MNQALLEAIWNSGALLLYIGSSLLILRGILSRQEVDYKGPIKITLVAMVFHGLALTPHWLTLSSGFVSLGPALSVVAWLVMLLFMFALTRQPVLSLGLVLQPYAISAILASWLLPGAQTAGDPISLSAIVHMLIALLAYSLLALGFGLAILLLVQDWQLQNKKAGGFFRSLPPMQTLENLLFQIIVLGFGLLTVALISGVIFSKELFGKAFQFNHHIVLSLLGWVAFGALIIGRMIYGLRGRVAAIWTISSFALLMLAYYGTKLVVEVLIQ